MTEGKRCIVKNCENYEFNPTKPIDEQDSHGEFIGDLCSPCHEYIAGGNSNHSQAYRNALTTAAARLILDISCSNVTIRV